MLSRPRAWSREPKEDPMSTTVPATGATTTPAHAKPRRPRAQLSEGAKQERRLAFWLCAPAVLVMIAVTAYPLVYAVILSFEKYNLEFPQDVKFIGFANYAAVLS